MKIFSSEQAQFAERLHEALSDAGYQNDSVTRLTQRFNRQYPQHAVSVHAVRKWMKGEAIPTQGKVLALADWLGVNAAWLRFDGEDVKTDHPIRSDTHISDSERRLLLDYRRLDPDERALVDRLLELFQRRFEC